MHGCQLWRLLCGLLVALVLTGVSPYGESEDGRLLRSLALEVEMQGAGDTRHTAHFDCDPAPLRSDGVEGQVRRFCARNNGCADEAAARAALAASCAERIGALRADATHALWQRLSAIVTGGFGPGDPRAAAVERTPPPPSVAADATTPLGDDGWRADWMTQWAFGERADRECSGNGGDGTDVDVGGDGAGQPAGVSTATLAAAATAASPCGDGYGDADPVVARRLRARASQVGAVAFGDVLPGFEGEPSCAAPSDIERKIGACPLYEGYSQLVVVNHAAGGGGTIPITDAMLAALRGAVAPHGDRGVAAEAWTSLGRAWFDAEEMEFSLAAYVV